MHCMLRRQIKEIYLDYIALISVQISRHCSFYWPMSRVDLLLWFPILSFILSTFSLVLDLLFCGIGRHAVDM